MCLTGEGSDELFGGYVYFADAPDAKSFQGELNRIYLALENVNLKRADRMTMAHGIEARVPFLDLEFTAKAMSLHPKHKLIGKAKHQREKAYLRNMFKVCVMTALPYVSYIFFFHWWWLTSVSAQKVAQVKVKHLNLLCFGKF
jgi:asparagine synthetase B (glutamine-hydrolysing)